MLTIVRTHSVSCRKCGDDLGECMRPDCKLTRDHKTPADSLCVWCLQHPDWDNAA